MVNTENEKNSEAKEDKKHGKRYFQNVPQKQVYNMKRHRKNSNNFPK